MHISITVIVLQIHVYNNCIFFLQTQWALTPLSNCVWKKSICFAKYSSFFLLSPFKYVDSTRYAASNTWLSCGLSVAVGRSVWRSCTRRSTIWWSKLNDCVTSNLYTINSNWNNYTIFFFKYLIYMTYVIIGHYEAGLNDVFLRKKTHWCL